VVGAGLEREGDREGEAVEDANNQLNQRTNIIIQERNIYKPVFRVRI
jgi:hypothetical protein